MKELRFKRVIHFSTKAPYSNLHHIGIAVEVNVPYLFGEIQAGQNFPLLSHQKGKQRKFLGGQIERVPALLALRLRRSSSRSPTFKTFCRLASATTCPLRRPNARTRASNSDNANGLTR